MNIIKNLSWVFILVWAFMLILAFNSMDQFAGRDLGIMILGWAYLATWVRLIVKYDYPNERVIITRILFGSSFIGILVMSILAFIIIVSNITITKTDLTFYIFQYMTLTCSMTVARDAV